MEDVGAVAEVHIGANAVKLAIRSREERKPKAEPRYGFKVRLDHKYPEKWRQLSSARLKQIPQLLPLVLRYFWWYSKMRRADRIPVMNYLKTQDGKQIYGVPLGGIGGGSINRGFGGEFCRYALRPGLYEYETVIPNQFIATIRNGKGDTIYHQVLSTLKNPKILRAWKWGFDGSKASYTGLYPRAWTTYDIVEHNVKLRCRQVSPVIPNNYKDTSLPCAVFIWDVENNSGDDLSVSITFTFASGVGSRKSDQQGDKWTEFFDGADGLSGVMIHQEISEMPCTYAISSKSREGVEVTRLLNFDMTDGGEVLWRDLNEDGKLDEISTASPKSVRQIAAAVSSRVLVKAKESKELEFALVWDMPKIIFPLKMREYLRYYTKYFHYPERSAAPEISAYALASYSDWENQIFEWQREVLEDPELPDWYKSALFNELYFVSDGGTIWLRGEDSDNFSASDPRIEFGRFAYLEGHEYRMYNTYDVHFYAAFALVQLWPKLQEVLQYEFRDAVSIEDKTMISMLYDGVRQPRKVKHSMPHDIGDPAEEPFKLVNAYPVHDVSDWKDLNSKYVLSCYRDYKLSGDIDYLKNMWPAIKDMMEKSLLWDKDGDGLIENEGYPDQTFDTWVMEGNSSYCGGLWLGALKCASAIADLLGYPEESKKYCDILEKGNQAFQTKLWNGQYYDFDTGTKSHSKSIMSDQLCGQWFLRATGFGHEIFPEDRVKSALETIYKNNVLKYKNGMQGAVNGFTLSHGIDTYTVQSEEMWIGVTYGLAALMIHEGLTEIGFKTAEGVYRTVYEKIGMGFETPEALYENNIYRAIGYMRPLSIWAMQHAWRMRRTDSSA